MNTLEINYKGKIKSFSDLFKFAKKQFVEYEKLEGRDWKEYDFSIDCAEDQMLFKDMLQIRCIEELTEATEAINDKDHFMEEVTDAINFFLSSYCMLDVNFDEFMDLDELLKDNINPDFITYEDCAYYFYLIIQDIGNLCNLLKNRPWAQSNYLVSMVDFNNRLHDLWDTFWKVIWWLGLSSKQVFELFERKYEVNKWRIKTGY
jgi:hypothetical protein